MIPWLLTTALADPCGMVPPLELGDAGIARQGHQRTFVAHSNGVQTLALRPGFVGDAAQFGMLVPLPDVPTLSKLDDGFFAELEDALDPRPLTLRLVPKDRGLPSIGAPPPSHGPPLSLDPVTLLSTTAVGMYTAAVLRAGSAEALSAWMAVNGFRFPAGMEAVCDAYIAQGWVFVAIKTRVAAESGVTPSPGARTVEASLPDGVRYRGHVQGLVFEFAAAEPVIPMRLSVFNGPAAPNVVYALTDGPVRIAELPTSAVTLQRPGEALFTRLTEPLELVVQGGSLDALPASDRAALAATRDPHRRYAALRRQWTTTGPDPERAELERISADLGVAGPGLDRALRSALDPNPEAPLQQLRSQTLTVIEGTFDPEVLGAHNLTLSPFTLDDAPQRDDPLAPTDRSAVLGVR